MMSITTQLCEFTRNGVRYNYTTALLDMISFMTTDDVIDDIEHFAPITSTSRAQMKRRVETLSIRCLGTKGNSNYDSIQHLITYRIYGVGVTLTQHIFLHELMHVYTLYECWTFGVPRTNATSHCRAFKRALLRADLLYGLLTDTEFQALENGIDVISPHEPYTFERSYGDTLKPTTRVAFLYEQKELSVNKRKDSNSNLTSIVGRIGLVLKSLKTSLKDIYVIPKGVAIQIQNSNLSETLSAQIKSLEDRFPRLFVERSQQYQLGTVKAQIQAKLQYASPDLLRSEIIQATIHLTTIDEIEVLAAKYADFFSVDMPSIKFRHALEIKYKFSKTPPIEGGVFVPDTSAPYPDRPKFYQVGASNTLSRIDSSEYFAQKILNGVPFDIELTDKQDRRYAFSFDGYFLSRNSDTIYFEFDNRPMCFASTLKTDTLSAPISTFANVYDFQIGEMKDTILAFISSTITPNIESFSRVCIFDTDTLFYNLLALIRFESELVHHEHAADFASCAQFTSLAEFVSWASKCIIQPTTLVGSGYYYPSFLLALQNYLLPRDEFFAIAKPLENKIRGVRQAFLCAEMFDLAEIAEYIQKGIPFLFPYAEKVTLPNTWVFLFFDGQKLVAFDGTRLNATTNELDMSSIISQIKDESEMDLFSLNFLDFGKSTLPRANFKERPSLGNINHLLNCPIYGYGDNLTFNLYSIPEDIYVNDILNNLTLMPTLLLKRVIKTPNQMLAVLDKDEMRFVNVDKDGYASVISSVYAWWLLAL